MLILIIDPEVHCSRSRCPGQTPKHTFTQNARNLIKLPLFTLSTFFFLTSEVFIDSDNLRRRARKGLHSVLQLRSRLDYCNSLFSGCPKHLLEKPRKVPNSAARLVLKAHKRDHISPLLRTLHWLPIQACIEFKLSTLSHSFFSDTAPVYLSDFLRVYSPSRQLCSLSDSRTLRIPHIKTKTFGHRSFSHAAPSVWNSLPHDIRHNQSATAFKTALKTHLFKSYLC